MTSPGEKYRSVGWWLKTVEWILGANLAKKTHYLGSRIMWTSMLTWLFFRTNLNFIFDAWKCAVLYKLYLLPSKKNQTQGLCVQIQTLGLNFFPGKEFFFSEWRYSTSTRSVNNFRCIIHLDHIFFKIERVTFAFLLREMNFSYNRIERKRKTWCIIFAFPVMKKERS